MNEELNPISTTRFGLKFGLYCGVALSLYEVLILELGLSDDNLIGLLAYVILIAALHMGMRDYKKANEGYMTFGQGLGIGLIVSTISGILLGAIQSVYFYFKPALVERMKEEIFKAYDEQGIPPEQVETMRSVIDFMLSPGGIFVLTVISYFILGLLLSLITAAVHRRNPPLFD